jgi:hypothetical protein
MIFHDVIKQEMSYVLNRYVNTTSDDSDLCKVARTVPNLFPVPSKQRTIVREDGSLAYGF